MPGWLAILLGVAAALTAARTVWRLFIHPIAELIVLQRQALPLLRELVDAFGDVAHPFSVLEEIVAEFRTDSGSSLRDVVDRLDAAATANAAAADVLKVQVEASRMLAVQDREQMVRLTLMVDRLTVAAASVADDLAESHRRADAVTGPAGEAADAAMRSADPLRRDLPWPRS